jgi:thiamine-phosphate pyrophosphorylase
MASAPQLYIVTDRRATGGRPLVEVIAEALEGARGAGDRVAVQLREKDLDARSLIELAKQLRMVTAAAGVRLYVNDRIDVAMAVGADGVHLGGRSLAPADVRALAPGLGIGVSTHSRAEVQAAADAKADFVVFGPVWATPAKPDWIIGLAQLEQVTSVPIPVLAIGGIDRRNARSCIEAGASGVACIRSVISTTKLAETVSSLLACIEGIRS